eukprot:GHVR01149411.1.p1 GENE.GHVR01149411.1~~GHVR01149411.1.p1  ORF type:complete len:175 (-),score=21.21 GHVR01149411.1:145-669(-)
MNNSQIEKKAEAVILDTVSLKAPVDVYEIASIMDIDIVNQDLDDDISGFLVRKNGKNVIGLNQNQHEVRQRFTISHELGHYYLHINQHLFVDYYKGSKLFRGNNQSYDYNMEREANAFAAALLMPKKLIKQELKSISEELSYEEKLEIMGSVFKVSKQAMDYRLKTLGYYDYGF